MVTPSELLSRAADLIRDTAADTTKPRNPNWPWTILDEDDGWKPGTPTVVCCSGYGGTDVVAERVDVVDARWIALLEPGIVSGDGR